MTRFFFGYNIQKNIEIEMNNSGEEKEREVEIRRTHAKIKDSFVPFWSLWMKRRGSMQ
jgi:hypothetical protein